jgi:hypothetical protein
MLTVYLVQHRSTRSVLGLDLIRAQFVPAVLLEELPRSLVSAQHRQLLQKRTSHTLMVFTMTDVSQMLLRHGHSTKGFCREALHLTRS